MAEKNPIDKAGKTLPPLRPQREFIAKTAGLSFERQELTIIQRSNTQSILPADFEQRINTLRTCFKTTTISSCVCFRPTRSTGFFGHFGCSIKLCSHFADIDRKLLERAKLVLMKNCLLRLQNSLKFIEELEQNMDASVSMQRALHAGHAKRFSWKSFPLKKEKFHLICQTARVHIGHWSALRQKIISDVHLRTQLPDLLTNLKTVQLRLFQNTEKISMWVGKLLLIAIEACNRLTWNIPDEALRLLSQAIDEFNDLLEFGKSSLAECEAVFSLYDLGSRSVAMLRERLHLHFSFSPQLLLMRSISLNKLLNSIACERSRIFCAEVLSLFNRNSELEKSSKFVFACVLDWEDLSSLTGDSDQKPQGPYTPNGVVTMLTRNQVPALRIESCSPLLSFEIEEQQFINQLVAHLATCRTLLPPCHSGSGNRQMLLHKSVPTYPVPVEEVPRPVEISPLPFLKSNAIQHETETGHSILKHHPSEDSPKLGKRVQWSVALGPGLRDQLCSNYMAMVWSKVAFEFCHMVGELVWSDKSADNGKLRPLPLLSNSVITTLVRLLEALRMSGSLPTAGAQSLQQVARHLHCSVAVACWDTEFCGFLGITLKDKCKVTDEILEGQPATKTVRAMLSLLEPLHSVFQSASQWKSISGNLLESHSSQIHHHSNKTQLSSLLPIVTRLHALLSFCLYWFDTKIRQFLSAWSLEPMLLLTQWELPLFTDGMNKTLALAQPLCTRDMPSLSSMVALQDLWSDTQQKALAIETLSHKSSTMFASDLRKMSTEFFQEAMPQGKSWRRSRHSGRPFQPSSYAEHAVTQMLEPVVESTAMLSYDIQLSVMTLAVNTMMEAWSNYILKEEIVFSFYGGQQIQLDFNHVKSWISSEASCLASEIQSHLLGLDVFKHLDGAVHLLMLQPRKKKQSANELDVELESNSSTVSSSSVISSLSGVDMEGYDLDVLSDTSIPNRQQWLDLRLRGGGKSKRGLMPFCLRTQETK